MNLKHIPETCQTCGAEPRREERDSYAGIDSEGRVYLCGASIVWSSNERHGYVVRCPKDPVAIKIKAERVAVLKKILKAINEATFTEPSDANRFRERIQAAQGWFDIKAEDLR